jgi:hypothetical protein
MFSLRSVTCIIPRLPPAIDGVGDYALNLAQQLRQDIGIETNFLVGDRSWDRATEIAFPTSKVSEHSAQALLSLLPSNIQTPTTVLLHYVNYGYAKRGCPVWLVSGLERWRSASPNRTLVTMFHEISASGPILSSAFWLASLQRDLAARLARVSDHCLTSKQLYAEILSDISQGKHTKISTLPVFSNIGEPARVSLLAERHRRLVVFGGRSNRLRVYQDCLKELDLACKLLKIEEIWDIGLPTGLNLPIVNGMPVIEKGQQSALTLSYILLNSLAGFFNYPTDFLAKSTIFAAYCAHSLLPVSPKPGAMPADGIESGKHYWFPDAQATRLNNLAEMQAIADNAYTWYQTHNLSVQAQTFARNLLNTTVSPCQFNFPNPDK